MLRQWLVISLNTRSLVWKPSGDRCEGAGRLGTREATGLKN